LMGSAIMLAQASKAMPPKPIHMVNPKYPDRAVGKRIEATVLVMLTIPPDGLPKDIKIAEGFRPDFDESAIDAARQWRFRPAIRDGKPIEVTVKLQFLFKPR